MNRRTPGPWHLGEDGLTIIAADGYELGGIADATPSEGGRPGEDQANARLIAAAPDLLMACKAARIQAPGWLESVKAAVARAEGQDME